MKNIIILLLVVSAGWYGYSQYQRRAHIPVAGATPANGRFTCDGRIYCSQMTSCDEATYFLQNCPGTKMDGNNDGVPCEKQWCN